MTPGGVLVLFHLMLKKLLSYGWERLLRLLVILLLILLGLWVLRYGVASVPSTFAVIVPALFVAAFVRP